MKKNLVFNKLFISILCMNIFYTCIAQNDLGKSCGCPPVNARDSVNISTLPGYNGSTYELAAGAIFTCDHIYILNNITYVPNGQVLKIAPGTLIKGKSGTSPQTETAIIIERGGRIDACGTSECPIVFTADGDRLDGKYPLSNTGQWGGIAILGRASNNLTLSCNGPVNDAKYCIADGLGLFPNFDYYPVSKNWFGADVNNEPFNDNDNSGTLKYVSIRHTGALFPYRDRYEEFNGLSLASVGSSTTIDHVEVTSCKGDGIAILGGTVNLKYVSVLFGNDDMIDWDLGYTGKMQFLFGMKATTATSVDSDNGFEGDSDDNKCRFNVPRANPIVYNATFIGNAKTTKVGDNSAIAGINMKEGSQGEIHNSIFTDFKNGLNFANVGPAPDAYNQWIGGSLIIACNTFVNCTNDFTINEMLVPSDANRDKFIADKNTTIATSASIGMVTPFSNGVPVVDAVPVLQSTTGCSPLPADGFFINAPYRGAFAPAGKNWLSEWSLAAIKQYLQSLQACPTDVTDDHQTTNADLSQILLEFGRNCK